jgi:putative ABC transport system permease protein
MFTLIFRNILRNPRRSLLTLASTAISLALLGLLVAIYHGFFLSGPDTPSDALRLISRHKVSLANPLPASHLERIRAIDGVAEVSPWTWYQGTWRDRQSFFARFGCDPETIFKIRQDFSIPPDQLEEFKRTPNGTVIARALATKYKFAIGDTINIKGDIYPVNLELKLVGIFEHKPNNDLLMFHQKYLRELMNARGDTGGRDFVGTYAILASDPARVPAVVRAIDAAFANSPFPTKTETEKEFVRGFLAFIGNVKLFLTVICAAVTFTILLVCANTISMSVRERTREMAIFRTVGYTPAEIMRLVVIESVVITLAGGVIGMGIAYLLGKAASQGGGGGFALPPFSLEAAVVTFSMALLIGVVSSIFPAFLASRKNIVESLRFTG